MKKILLFLSLISNSFIINAQVKVNQNAANSAINTSSAFMDASSSPLWNGTTNQGKGMLYPRVDLVAFTAMSHAGPFNASNNPNYFDGLLVFNTATGVAGIGADSVFPGYYYYRNTTTTANGGHWVSLKGIKGDDGATGSQGPTGLTGANGTSGTLITTYSAVGTTLVNVSGGTASIPLTDLPQMAITFTPNNSRVFLHFSMSNGSYVWGGYKILLDGIVIGGDVRSQLTSNTQNANNNVNDFLMVNLTPSVPHTIKVQYYVNGIGSPPYGYFYNDPTNPGYYRQLVIEDRP